MAAAVVVEAVGGGSTAFARTQDDLTDYFILPDPAVANSLQDAPERIVQDGMIRAGLFRTPFRDMNLHEALSLGGKTRNWLGIPKMLEWVGLGLAHPQWYFGLIMVNAQSASLAALYGCNRETGEVFSHDSFGSVRRVRVAQSMWNDVTSYHKHKFDIEVRHDLEQGTHKLLIDIRAVGSRPAIEAEMILHEDLTRIQPLVRLSPLSRGRFIFNHKAQMPILGTLRLDGRAVEFDPLRDAANMDEVRSFSDTGFKNDYNWFNFGGFDKQGRLIGLNAFHSDLRPDRWTENCIWVDKRLSLLGRVRFEMNRQDPNEPWRAVEENGRIDVSFFPEGGKTVDLGAFGIYVQKCGRFQGILIDDSGERHQVDDYCGCAEYADVF